VVRIIVAVHVGNLQCGFEYGRFDGHLGFIRSVS
jgi:hypothetical protein